MFPQGEIQSLYDNTIRFDKGLESILKKVTGEIHIIYLVSLVDYFSQQKPGLYMYFKEYNDRYFTTGNMEKEYEIFYSQCRDNNIGMSKSI
jgi:hypothetical protein